MLDRICDEIARSEHPKCLKSGDILSFSPPKRVVVVVVFENSTVEREIKKQTKTQPPPLFFSLPHLKKKNDRRPPSSPRPRPRPAAGSASRAPRSRGGEARTSPSGGREGSTAGPRCDTRRSPWVRCPRRCGSSRAAAGAGAPGREVSGGCREMGFAVVEWEEKRERERERKEKARRNEKERGRSLQERKKKPETKKNKKNPL